MQYVGESERSLQDRFSEHLGYVKNKHLTKATGGHYNLPGHTVSDMRVTIVEKIHSSDPLIRKQREELFIQKLNTKYKGLNKKWRIALQVIFLKNKFQFYFRLWNLKISRSSKLWINSLMMDS